MADPEFCGAAVRLRTGMAPGPPCAKDARSLAAIPGAAAHRQCAPYTRGWSSCVFLTFTSIVYI